MAKDFFTQEISSNLTEMSFVSLSIYLEALSYEYIYEAPKISVKDLLANIGGNLSLFLGLSIFTLFKLIEIFF